MLALGTNSLHLLLLMSLKASVLQVGGVLASHEIFVSLKHLSYLQPIITQYFIDNKSEIWLLFLIAHSKR